MASARRPGRPWPTPSATPRRLATLSRGACAAPRRLIPRRRVLGLAVERTDVPNVLAAARAELPRSHHDVDVVDGGVGRPRQVREPQRAAGAPPARGLRLAAGARRRRRAAPGFLDTFVFLAERFGLRARPAGPPVALPRRLAGDPPPARRCSCARRRSSRSGRCRALRADTFDALLPFPALRVGLGPGRALGRGRARARVARSASSTRLPIRHGLRRIAASYDREAAIAEGRALPRRAALHRPRPRPSAPSPPTGAGDEGRDRRRVLPAGRRTRPWACGRTARRWPRATPGADVRVLVLHRPLPPLADARRLRRAALRDAVRQPGRDVLDGIRVDYVRYLSPPRPWSYASWGAWAAPALRRALRACAPSSRSSSSTRTTPCPPATRCAAPRRGSRCSSRSTAATSTARHAGAPHGAPHARSRATGAGQQRRARHGAASSAGPAQTRVVHLGTDLPPAPAAPPGRADAGHGGQPDRPQAPRRRHRGAGPPGRPPAGSCATSSSATAPSASACARWLPRAASLTGSSCAGACPTPRRWRGPPAVAVRAAQRRRGVRGRLRGGDGRRACRRSARRGEDGPEEIAAAGGGIELVAPGDPRGAGGHRSTRCWPTSGAWRRCAGRARDRGPCVHLAAVRPRDRRRLRGGAPWLTPRERADGSAPYDADNLLDRHSRRATLELNYRHMMERERALRGPPRSACDGGDVLSVGCGWHPGRHLFPAPAFRLVGADADPAKVAGVLETGRADEGVVGYAGRLGLAPRSFDVVLYRLVLHHLAFQGPLGPCFEEAARLLRPGWRAGRRRARAVASGGRGAGAGQPDRPGHARARDARRHPALAAPAGRRGARGGA